MIPCHALGQVTVTVAPPASIDRCERTTTYGIKKWSNLSNVSAPCSLPFGVLCVLLLPKSLMSLRTKVLQDFFCFGFGWVSGYQRVCCSYPQVTGEWLAVDMLDSLDVAYYTPLIFG
jgi:hypothetical protein